MMKSMRLRFWLEAAMATITSVLLVMTLIWEDWVEEIFGISPDAGNGSFERWLVGTLIVVTITLFVMVRSEWRRTRASMSTA